MATPTQSERKKRHTLVDQILELTYSPSFLVDVPFFGVQTASSASLQACRERSEPIFFFRHHNVLKPKKMRSVFFPRLRQPH